MLLALGVGAASPARGAEPAARVELAMELGTGRLVIDRRAGARLPGGGLPAGSLVKPFTTLAWARTHELREAPALTCGPGGPPACWYPPGHGVLGLEAALGLSCNAYFRGLARAVDPGEFAAVLAEFGLPPVPPGSDLAAAMVGTDAGHRMEPRALLAAFAALVGDGGLWVPAARTPLYRGQPRVPDPVRALFRAGFTRGAREGTTRLVGEAGALHAGYLGKTGTAAALAPDGAPDPEATAGWFVGVAPRAGPTVAALVYLGRGTGSRHAAPRGGRVLAEALRSLARR